MPLVCAPLYFPAKGQSLAAGAYVIEKRSSDLL